MVAQPLSREPISPAPPPFLARAAAAFAAALALTIVAALAFSLGVSLLNLGRVLPGVHMGGLDLSGLSRSQAAALVGQRINFPDSGHVVLRYGERTWDFTPAQLGLSLDAQASAAAAYGFGRSLWPWQNVTEKVQSLEDGADLSPRMVFDGQVAYQVLQSVATAINQPTIEAQLTITGLNVQFQPGQVGLSLDTEKTVGWLGAQLLTMQDVEVPLAVDETPPRILDASQQADIARQILSQPLIVKPGGDYEDNPDPWTIDPDTLAGMLGVERVETGDGAHYQIGLDGQQLGAILAGFAPNVSTQPRNARFSFNEETKQLDIYKPAVIGRTLNLQSSIESINQQISQGAHQVELQYDYTNPDIVNDIKAQDLGITEIVSQQTTYFYGSSAERAQNIKTAAERFNGLLVPPGAVFSMVDNIGDISLESGFAEALIIFGDRTIKGVGGGVCQVSTTLFRTVFFGGFPIVERWPHAYRVGYYEMDASGNNRTDKVGLDATVYAPIVDFKFQNDTPSWILMETDFDPNGSLTWTFYSTSDGRTVAWDTSGIHNITDPPDNVYEENSELAKGQVKQVDWAVQGGDVTIHRTVTRDGVNINQDTIATQYQAWPNVYQYGPGTQGYPPKKVKGTN